MGFGAARRSLLLFFMALCMGALVAWRVARPWGAKRSQTPPLDTPKSSSRTSPPAPLIEAPIKRVRGGMDVTFYVASDTHLGLKTPMPVNRDPVEEPVWIERLNLAMIEQMNQMQGQAFPAELGGKVGRPWGVLISGDLTEKGGRTQWQIFERFYGSRGTEGVLEIPVFEGAGNHDRTRNWYVREQVARRHGGRFYSFDFHDLHLICLGEGPDEKGLQFLEQDLARVDEEVPIVVYLHYPLRGAFAEDNWFGRGPYRQELREKLSGHRVVGIFHGHYHASGAYRWFDLDVYNVGSVKHDWRSYSVVHVTDSEMVVASWNVEARAFWWWHRKPLRRGGPKEQVRVLKLPAVRVKPQVNL